MQQSNSNTNCMQGHLYRLVQRHRKLKDHEDEEGQISED